MDFRRAASASARKTRTIWIVIDATEALAARFSQEAEMTVSPSPGWSVYCRRSRTSIRFPAGLVHAQKAHFTFTDTAPACSQSRTASLAAPMASPRRLPREMVSYLELSMGRGTIDSTS
jgi:hypothetical protein